MRFKRFILSYAVLLLSLVSVQVYAENSAVFQHPVYQKLQQILPLYEQAVKNPWPILTTRKVLMLGVQDPSVILLRERLSRTLDLPSSESINNPLFDEHLDKAVRLFQERHALKVDGEVGQDTRNALNVSPQRRVEQIRLNLERWARFIPQAGAQYVWINVPDYRLRLVNNHQTIMTSKVIVGKPTRATPEIDSAIKRVILNPSWTVPPTIARKDVIPKIISDPHYLNEHRMHIYDAAHSGAELSPQEIDLEDLSQNPSRYIIRQEPGPHNALGQVKFEFDNRHSIYLHDTPTKDLFEEEKRLFSSGCVRLQNPLELFTALAEMDESLRAKMPQVEEVLDSGETTVLTLSHPIPIRVTYITVWVDDNGALHFWDDVYKIDHRLMVQKNNERMDLPQPV